jgi:hypothetical protein
MMVALVVIALIAGSAVMVSAQGVGTDPFDPVQLRTTPAADEQGTTEVGNPAFGEYQILINGWIEAFAYVSAYDNHISFGVMDPDTGTFAAPYNRYAFSQTGEANPLLPSTGTNWTDKGGTEVGGQDPLYVVNNSSDDFDLAGILIETNARLDMSLSMGGFMRRVDTAGLPFAGEDTRRADGGPYELANQFKMVLKGRFLDGTYPGPDQDDPGTQYASPTSGETTDYNTWTSWDNLGTNAINNEGGWLWPVDVGAMDNDPWTGDASLAYVNTLGPWDQLDEFDLVVERGQAQGTPGSLSAPTGTDGPSEAAEIWWAERVLRRGLQDVAGNYRADRFITLTYREADTQWIPTVKP